VKQVTKALDEPFSVYRLNGTIDNNPKFEQNASVTQVGHSHMLL